MDNSTYSIRSTNAIRPTDCLYRIAVNNPVELGEEPPESYDTSNKMPSHEMALQEIRARLENQKVRLLQSLAAVDYNLDHLESLYAMPLPPLSGLTAEFDALKTNFQCIKDTPGDFKMHGLKVSNNYLNAGPLLYVFQLNEYAPVVFEFSNDLCQLILRAMHEVGIEKVSDWNGVGLNSWSVRVRLV